MGVLEPWAEPTAAQQREIEQATAAARERHADARARIAESERRHAPQLAEARATLATVPQRAEAEADVAAARERVAHLTAALAVARAVQGAVSIADAEGALACAEAALRQTRSDAMKRLLDGVRAAAVAIVAADDRVIARLEAEHRRRLRERDGWADAEAARDLLALLIAEQI